MSITIAMDGFWQTRTLARAVSFFAAVALLLAPPALDLQGKPAPGKTLETLPEVFSKSVPSSMEDLGAIEAHIEDLAKRVSKAVVAVRVGSSVGSAVVISQDGLVLCAAHVCGAPGRDASFTFPNGRTVRGKTLGTDQGMDAALMKITQAGLWPWVPIGEPDDLRLGDWVLALGHPGGFEPKRPTVARLGRVLRLSRFLRTDCTLISGDSGGPLFDMHGRVVGIHSRISEDTSDNYHVPMSAFLGNWDRLARGETWGDEQPPSRSTIGVRGVDAEEGCLLERVNEDGPAYAAGLRRGDIVIRVNDEVVPDADCFAHCIRQAAPGDSVSVLVKRDQSEISFKVTVQARQRRGPDRPE